MTGPGGGTALERFRACYLEGCTGLLAECEARLSRISAQPGGRLGESCSLTLSAGGKRLRPLLVFLSARRGFPISGPHHAAAVAVELVHMASLVHDDVMDGADLRRGKPTLAARYGIRTSSAAGDYLFSSAFSALTEAGSPRAVSLLADASLGLSRGEILQMEQSRDFTVAEADYEERCRLKTAGLFSAACCLGAMLSGCEPRTVEAMDDYGRCLGMAFQITDDILDFAGDAGELGKHAGTDLRDGTVTLPLIHALREDSSLPGLLEAQMTGANISEICRRVKKAGGLDRAAQAAAGFVEKAGRAAQAAAAEIDTGPLLLVAEMSADRKV